MAAAPAGSDGENAKGKLSIWLGGGQQRPLPHPQSRKRSRNPEAAPPSDHNICAAFYLSAANQSPDHQYTFAAYHPFAAVIALTHVSTVVRLETGVLI